MATISLLLDGYFMVFMLYICINWLMLFPVRDRLHMPWWGIALLTAAEAIAVYQILHAFWAGNILIMFLFYLVFSRAADTETYKLLYLNMVAVAYTTICNLIFFMIWGPSYNWSWGEMAWMLLAYIATAPVLGYAICHIFWPKLNRLHLPNSGWLWIVPASAMIIMMLVGSAHVQFLMTGYDDIYGLTSSMVVLLTAGVSIMILVILQKNQVAANQKHDLAMVTMRMASQSRRYVEVTEHIDEIRIMRHDLRHHMRIASMLLSEGNLTALRTFLGEMEQDSRLQDNIVYSHNHISDLVAHYAVNASRDAGIHLAIRCGLPKSFWVCDTDLCILLGNLMDNAINACKLQAEGQREIKVMTAVRQGEAYICVENSCAQAELDTPARRDEAGVPKSNGYGIPSVRNVAAKYKGIASFEQGLGCFKATVLLQKPHSACAEDTADQKEEKIAAKS